MLRLFLITTRGFAKKASKGSESSAAAATGTVNNADKLLEVMNTCKDKIKLTLDKFDTKLSTLRVDATPSLVEKIPVTLPGSKSSVWLSTIAMITCPSPVKISITLNEKLHTPIVEKSILSSGFQPKSDPHLGLIDINFPKTTREQREIKVKSVGEEVEKIKIALRAVRQDAQKKIKQLKLPEDENKKVEKQINNLTTQAEQNVVKTGDLKKKELLGNSSKGEIDEDDF